MRARRHPAGGSRGRRALYTPLAPRATCTRADAPSCACSASRISVHCCSGRCPARHATSSAATPSPWMNWREAFSAERGAARQLRNRAHGNAPDMSARCNSMAAKRCTSTDGYERSTVSPTTAPSGSAPTCALVLPLAKWNSNTARVRSSVSGVQTGADSGDTRIPPSRRRCVAHTISLRSSRQSVVLASSDRASPPPCWTMEARALSARSVRRQ